MGTFNWIEILLILGMVQGFLLAMILPKLTKTNKEATKLLSILLVVVSLSVVLFLNSYLYESWPARLQVFLDSLAFLFAPLIYLYFQKLLFINKNQKLWFLHFIPAVLHFLYGISILRYSDQEMITLIQSGYFLIEWGIIFSGLVILTLGYWYASLRMLITFKKAHDKESGFRQNLTYLAVFLVALLIGDVVSIIFGLDHFFGIEIISGTHVFIGWISIPFLVYCITYFVIRKPEVLRIELLTDKPSVNRMSKERVLVYKVLLEKSMKEEKLYLDPRLTLTSLAQSLNMKPTQLSWLINTGFSCNFYDFVNSYRAEEFVKKLKNDEHKNQTLLSLAYDAGFNSKTTFNKTFKKVFKSTPREFLQKSASS
ncbi:helix-turn-helix domain-containing protein [Aquimarina sp. M1]